MLVNQISNKIAGIDLIIQNGKEMRIEPINRIIVTALSALGSFLIYQFSSVLFSLLSKTFRLNLVRRKKKKRNFLKI